MHKEPVAGFVNELLMDAIQKNISDIHIEPHEKDCRIRFRRNGLLYEAMRIPTDLSMRVVTRLKLLAQLNIAEHRLPQDGRIQFKEAGTVDIRLNCCPMMHGEKLVLRLLNTSSSLLNIHSLGMSPAQLKHFISVLEKPQGLILVTGPTGSGKTMTLYAALHFLNEIQHNISTVEDPIEIGLPGINQIQVNPKIGLDFPSVLRAFLRQDPDILMVGEIRDKETAQIAIQAAQTGHLVLSTLHTNSAAETILRLQNMNIEPYHLANALTCIIAQRLVRKLCPRCKLPDAFSPRTFQAHHCEQCHQGYNDRTGIFECIPITTDLSQLILSRASTHSLVKKIKESGHHCLHHSGIEKVSQGETSYSELARVIGECN